MTKELSRITRDKKIAVIYAAITLAITVFIFVNSLQNGEDSAKQSDFFVNIINPIISFFGITPDEHTVGVFVRKAAHFTEYFVLCATATMFLRVFKNKKLLFIPPIYCLAVAVTDEFVMQMITEGRAPQITDVLIDFSGALAGLLVVLMLSKRNKEVKKK